jgi:capsular polysaccharide biosynthesis protein
MQASILSRLVFALRHQWLIVTLIVIAGVAAALFLATSAHPKYTATTSILMVAGSADEATSQEMTTSTKPLLSADLPSLATGATVLSRLRNALKETTPLETLRARIRAKVSSESTIMQVDYTAKAPDKAVDGANKLGTEIIRFYRELATTRFDSLIGDLNSQLAARRSELARLDGELADTSRQYPFIDVKQPGSSDYGSQSVYQRLISLRAARDDLQVSLQGDTATAKASNKLIDNSVPLAIRDLVQSDLVFTHQQEQYAKDVAEYKRLSAYGSDRYPGLVELRRTVMREAISVQQARQRAASAALAGNSAYASALDARTRAQIQVSSDAAKVAAEDKTLNLLQAQISRKGIATYVARIRRDHDNSEAAYSILAGRLAKAIADRAEAASTGSVIVLDRARFASTSAAISGSIAAGAILFLSIWLALTAAMVIDGSQERFRYNVTIEKVYGAPVIGSVA